jgi:hypothetical protein
MTNFKTLTNNDIGMFISYLNMLISPRGKGYAIKPDLYNPCICINEEVSDIKYDS